MTALAARLTASAFNFERSSNNTAAVCAAVGTNQPLVAGDHGVDANGTDGASEEAAAAGAALMAATSAVDAAAGRGGFIAINVGVFVAIRVANCTNRW